MRLLIIIVFFFIAIMPLKAQELASDIDEAKKMASEKNQHIILVFQGSDWCGPCIKLDKEIWSTQEFKDYAKKHFVMLKADFPKRKINKLEKIQQEKNNKLAEKYNKQGFFPHVVVLNSNGTVLGRTGYRKMSPAKYIQLLNSF